MNHSNNDDIPLGRLMGDICRLQASRIDQFMDELGVFRSQGILLIILSDHDGLTHSEIAEKLRISPAAATKVIKRLEKLNYLKRRPDPSDERLSRVYILDDGRAVLQQIRGVFHNVHCLMFADISAEEQDHLRQILKRIYSNLQETQEKSVD